MITYRPLPYITIGKFNRVARDTYTNTIVSLGVWKNICSPRLNYVCPTSEGET